MMYVAIVYMAIALLFSAIARQVSRRTMLGFASPSGWRIVSLGLLWPVVAWQVVRNVHRELWAKENSPPPGTPIH
jgi:hypothetical protein